jgi:hypothetical protein
VVAVVLVQREPRAVGRDGFSESVKRLHVCDRSTLAQVAQRLDCEFRFIGEHNRFEAQQVRRR